MQSIFGQHKVIICVGAGGVGKTTISAALGVLAAKEGLRVLVMTIDPSKRLKVALGIDGSGVEARRVPGQNFKGELSALLLDAGKIFHEFVLGSTTDKKLSERLLKNRLYQQLSTTLSGSQEFTSLLQLSRVVKAQEYDLVILDTPPAQHAIDFLEAPEKIQALFEENIVRWFLGEEKSEGFIRKIITRGTRTVFAALDKITGSVFMSELNDFFRSVRAVQSEISQKTRQVQEILKSKETAFFLVSGFDEAKLREAEFMKAYLENSGHTLAGVLINRAFARWPKDERIEQPELAAIYAQWSHYHAAREKSFQEFRNKLTKSLPVYAVPDLNKELSGMESLEGVANEIAIYETQNQISAAVAAAASAVSMRRD